MPAWQDCGVSRLPEAAGLGIHPHRRRRRQVNSSVSIRLYRGSITRVTLRRFQIRFLCPASALLAALTFAPACGAETLTIGGAGTATGTMRALGAAFAASRPDLRVVVIPDLGTTGGSKALGRGLIDILATNRALRPAEGRDLVEIEYGRSPYVLATNMTQAVDLRTLGDVADVYTGKRRTWADGSRVRLILRRRDGTDSRHLQAFSPEMSNAVLVATARPGMLTASSDLEALRLIEEVPGALGATTLAVVLTEGRALKALPIAGVVPSPETLADGSYPHFEAMHLVRKENASQLVLQFFEFVRSESGREVLQRSGHLVRAK